MNGVRTKRCHVVRVAGSAGILVGSHESSAIPCTHRVCRAAELTRVAGYVSRGASVRAGGPPVGRLVGYANHGTSRATHSRTLARNDVRTYARPTDASGHNGPVDLLL